jgi:hypothetical protein
VELLRETIKTTKNKSCRIIKPEEIVADCRPSAIMGHKWGHKNRTLLTDGTSSR